MRKLFCLLGMVFLVCLTAAAQDDSKAQVFAGYSYIRANPATSGAPSFNLNGGSASFAFTPGAFGIVGDFGGYHVGTISGVSVDSNVYTYLFGPRYSFRHNEHFTPFVQALFGGAHVADTGVFGSSTSQNAFAMTIGGGLDLNATRHLAIRVGQVEYLLTRFEESPGNRMTQNNIRASAGIVFRF